MRTGLSILLLSLIVALPASAQLIRKVLFLGNSYTYSNNMPQILASIADGMGDSLIYDSHLPGGFTLDNHANAPLSTSKIAAGGWDYLVLQEQSQLPAFQTYFSNGTFGMASMFRTNSPCGRIMFYMTWGRKNGDASNCASWPPVCTYAGMDSLLRLRYIEMADWHRGDISPVGAAWRWIRLNYPNIELYQSDESHPSAAGSYLAACVFYTSIFKKDPTMINYNYGLPLSEATALKLAAKVVAYDSASFWDRVPEQPTAGFQYSIGTGINEVNFINTSTENADAYHWNFGNGATSTQKHPTYSFPANGTYTVTLTALNCDLGITYTDTVQKTISFCSFTPTITPSSLWLCPGVTDSLWTQIFDAYQWYDDTGGIIPGAISQYKPCSANNTYSVLATQNGCSEMSQPVSVFTYNQMATWSFMTEGNLIAPDTGCIGDTVLLWMAYNKPPFPHDSLVDWYFNGQPIAGLHNDSILITGSGEYTATLRHTNCQSLDKTFSIYFSFIPCAANIEELSAEPDVAVYPNPGNGLFTINSTQPASLQVSDVFGRRIRTESVVQRRHQLDLTDEPPGLYLLQILAEGKSLTLRLVKW